MAINFEHYRKTGAKTGKPNKPLGVPDAIIAEIMDRIKKGEGVGAMAREYGVSKSAVSMWVNGNRRVAATGGSLYDQV